MSLQRKSVATEFGLVVQFWNAKTILNALNKHTTRKQFSFYYCGRI